MESLLADYTSHQPLSHVAGLFASTPVLSRRRQFRIPQNTNWQWRSRKFSFFSPAFLARQVPTTVLMTQTAENRRDAAKILSAELGQSAACTPGDYQCGMGECCTSRGQCYNWRSSQRSPAIVGIVVSCLVVITIIVSIMECSYCACCPAYYRCRQSSSWKCDSFLWYPCHSAPALSTRQIAQ